MLPTSMLLLLVYGVQANAEVMGYFVAESIRDAVFQPDVTITSIQVLGVVDAFFLNPNARGYTQASGMLGLVGGGAPTRLTGLHKAEVPAAEYAAKIEAADKENQKDS